MKNVVNVNDFVKYLMLDVIVGNPHDVDNMLQHAAKRANIFMDNAKADFEKVLQANSQLFANTAILDEFLEYFLTLDYKTYFPDDTMLSDNTTIPVPDFFYDYGIADFGDFVATINLYCNWLSGNVDYED